MKYVLSFLQFAFAVYHFSLKTITDINCIHILRKFVFKWTKKKCVSQIAFQLLPGKCSCIISICMNTSGKSYHVFLLHVIFEKLQVQHYTINVFIKQSPCHSGNSSVLYHGVR